MSDWRSFTYYKIGNDVIGPNNRLYNCLVGHTSTVWEEDLANGYWERQGSVDEADYGDFLDGFGTPTSTFDNASEADSEVSPEGGN